MDPQTARTRAGVLQTAIASHKSAIRRHRHALHTAAMEFGALERECQSRGIRLTVTSNAGEEGSPPHGHTLAPLKS